ncbi:AAA family ATPase [Bradyrhizobium sp. 145]|uniref:AAA family ATPase n=1 Tax=Bradyrhizobium sp. 145 TaxID=2782621 RepID=UPI001FFBFAE9|nr:AAA family ATPase [Bradyrhizobium sp. 145]MCK1691619.1 AAA family ATPase [Bradyrhizobium sp. 145]
MMHVSTLKPIAELSPTQAQVEFMRFKKALKGKPPERTVRLLCTFANRFIEMQDCGLISESRVGVEEAIYGAALDLGLVDHFGGSRLDDLIQEAIGSAGRPSARALRIIDPAGWQDKPVPVREWIVPDMIPTGTVSLLMGDGGTGKSTLAMQLGIVRALRRHCLSCSWIGAVPTPGRTLYLSAEDDHDELHRRTAAILQQYDASFDQLEDFRPVDLVGEDAVLGELHRNGIIRATALLDLVEEQVDEFQADFVIVDALADAYAGDEINRSQVRQFIGLLKRIGRDYGTTFLCLGHPSLQGMNSGSGTSGSTGWSNSVRSRLYFEHGKGSDGKELEDPDLRQVSRMKANYAKLRVPPVMVRWKDGAFVLEQGAISSLDKIALAEKSKDVFMALLRQFNEQGQNVSPSRSSTYAPKRFASHPKAAGLSAKHLETAMQDLLDRKMITIETFGPPSRERQRLVYVG